MNPRFEHAAWWDRPGHSLGVAVAMLVLAACGEVADPAATAGVRVETTTTTTAPATTTTAAPTTTSSTVANTTTTAVQPAIVLGSDGLGVVDLGSDPDATVGALQAALGPPDEDSEWVSDTQNPLGFCGDEEWKLVRWGQLGVILTDGLDDYAPEGGRHFAHYGYGEWLDALGVTPVPPDQDPLQTAAGMTVGDTGDRVLELYGDQAEPFEGNEVFGPGIWIDLGDPYGITAWLDPDTSTVGFVQGGEPCGE